MRKCVYFSIVVIAFLAVFQTMVSAERGDLSRFTARSGPVKVFVGEVTDESGQSQVIPQEFKDVLEKSIANRRSVKFELVKEPASSDLQISAVIKKYQYLLKGPMKPSPSIATLALDAAATATQNYVEMSVKFEIIETGTNKVLWNDVITDYKKKVMTPGESVPIIYDKIARIFLWKAFGKSNNNQA